MTSNKLLVQKHRAKMTAMGCQRIEITIGRGIIGLARDLAKQKRWPLWQVVEEAIDAYVLSSRGPTGNEE